MFDVETGELRVVVPVGFLLSEEQEVSVSVERPDGGNLPIRLRLIPARMALTDLNQQTPVTFGWPARRLTVAHDDGYPAPDYGGGD
ncbi:MAG: hypothetical protein C0467_12150 [Planctomycetaceae bacterium]|nr:hypothetical protein [Planctomycetaceae bacterium]